MSGVDQIMKLADEWYSHGQTSHSGIDEKYAALRAAIEQIVADRDALRALLKQVRPHIMTATYLAECRLDNEDESEPYFSLSDLLARIDAALNPPSS